MRPFPLAAAALAFAIAGCSNNTPQKSQPSASVLVTTVKAVRGRLPATVIAYGSVAPSQNGIATVSVAQPGQLTSLSVTQGAAVQAGQVLATFTVAPSARSTYLQTVDTLAAARKQRETTAQLRAQQLATADQLVQADKAVSDARIALAALSAEGAASAVQTLRAPFSGIVTAVMAAQGDRTQAGAPIMTLARAGGLVVTAGIDPAQSTAVRSGASATLRRLSGDGTISGEVVRIDQMLNPRTRMIDVDVGFPPGALLAGESAQVAIETGTVSGWVVPHQSVVTAKGPPRIFQDVAGKAKAVPVQVRLGSPQGDVVEGAIDPRAPIIVSGAFQVNDGDAVRRGR